MTVRPDRRMLRTLAMAATLCAGAMAAGAYAQQRTAPPHRIGGAAAGRGPCVTVDVAGHRAGHLDCATTRLETAARTAQRDARAGLDAPMPHAGSPDVRVGVASEAATRLRMGSALGRSVMPERPTTILPPAGIRR